jgi:hypothetical protein
MGHGRVICRQCGTTISQCRCIEGHKNITYIDRCDTCLGKKQIDDAPTGS